MTRWQYEDLQEQLSRKMRNNPYGKNGNYKYEEGYKHKVFLRRKASCRTSIIGLRRKAKMYDVIDKSTLKPGDVVGVRMKTQIGWGFFRYPKTIPLTIERLEQILHEVV